MAKISEIKKDSELTTIGELSERILSLQQKVNTEESRPTKNNNISSFHTKHNKIMKLNHRIDLLWGRRAALLKQTKTEG